MLITKKESKQLRYFARANYKADVKGTTAEDGSKVKHRYFPVFGLSYDEKKADKGMVEITNIQVLYKPFEGTTFAELMEALNEVLGSDDGGEMVEAVGQNYKPCLLYGPECKQEPLPKGPSIVQRIKDSDEGKAIVETAEAITPLLVPGAVDAHAEITDYSPKTETLSVDVDARIPNSVHEIMINTEVKPVDGEKTLVVTGSVVPERHDSGRDYSGLSEEAIAEAYTSVVGDAPGSIKPGVAVAVEESLEYLATHEPPPLEETPEISVVENVEEAKKVSEETGKPVITAEQKPVVHLDAAADGTNDVSMVLSDPTPAPKKLSRAGLYDLQMKCGVMRLATLYGEAPGTGLDILMKKYPDAASRLNEVYAADGIKTYTITEEAIMKAYPDEYAALRK